MPRRVKLGLVYAWMALLLAGLLATRGMAANLGWVGLVRCMLGSETSPAYRARCGNSDALGRVQQFFFFTHRVDPESATALMGMAWTSADAGQYTQALNWLDVLAETKDLRDTEHHFGGTLSDLAGDTERAIQAWKMAKSERYFWLQGERFYSALHDSESARSQYELAIRINPQFSKPYLRLGQIFYAEGNLDQAQKAFETKVNLEPDGRSYAWLGNTLMRLGKPAEASAAYNRVAEANDMDAYMVVGDFYKTQGLLAESRNWYLRAYRNFPGDATSAIKLGELSLREEQIDQAHRYFLSALERAPNSPTSLYYMGYWFFVSGDYENALIWIDKAFSRGLMADYWVYRTLGDANARLSRCDIASDMYKAASRLSGTPESDRQAIMDRAQEVNGECASQK